MAVTIRVLGQAAPAAAVETALYTCATTSAVISSLNVCNFSGTTDTFTVRVCVGGAADVDEQFIFSGAMLPGNTTVGVTEGMTLATNDVVKVTSANGTCAFNLWGQEQ